ncbi:c-type cytochrome [Azospirillum sp. ST 5-10]|uniref:c-type cytochrome n=1 Tax=unclassified Azospirillum TaxID=2630922 RepID=UPI003F49F07F
MSLRTVPTVAVCLTALLWTAPALAGACALTGDAQEGAKAATACKGCHALEADAKPRPTGPNLHDVFDRKAGTDAAFPRYSAAMKAAADGGLVWTDGELEAYVADPKGYLAAKNGKTLPHGMFFQLKDAEKAKQVVAFLKAIKGNADCP